MSKYVIELGEDVKILQSINVTQYGNAYTNTELVGNLKELNSDYINEHYGSLQDEAYQKGINDGSLDVKLRVEGAYQHGLDDAWEAARKIADMWTRIDNSELLAVFGITERIGHSTINTLFGKQTASEAIAKLKAYEQKQSDKIKVRDEVVWTEDENVVIVVTCVYTEDNMEWCDGFCRDGKVYKILTEHARKTGRRFDIEGIMEEMKK